MSYTVPMHIPPELKAACKCESIDPDWPIQGPLDALAYLMEWSDIIGEPQYDHVYRITHSHHHEYSDLEKMGYDRLYKESLYTKYVSIGWHLAGRYYYDVALIDELTKLNWPKLRLIDFGAAPWIQAIFYKRKGFDVTVINQSLESDVNRFGRFLAQKNNVEGIKDYATDDTTWQIGPYDIIYAVDVFEHIPPNPDGTPGWVKYAEILKGALVPGGIWFVNAPLDKQSGIPRPVDTHKVHFTSPFTVQEWMEEKGCFTTEGYITRKKLTA